MTRGWSPWSSRPPSLGTSNSITSESVTTQGSEAFVDEAAGLLVPGRRLVAVVPLVVDQDGQRDQRLHRRDDDERGDHGLHHRRDVRWAIFSALDPPVPPGGAGGCGARRR